MSLSRMLHETHGFVVFVRCSYGTGAITPRPYVLSYSTSLKQQLIGTIFRPRGRAPSEEKTVLARGTVVPKFPTAYLVVPHSVKVVRVRVEDTYINKILGNVCTCKM